jgi:hypothetical protein
MPVNAPTALPTTSTIIKLMEAMPSSPETTQYGENCGGEKAT